MTNKKAKEELARWHGASRIEIGDFYVEQAAQDFLAGYAAAEKRAEAVIASLRETLEACVEPCPDLLPAQEIIGIKALCTMALEKLKAYRDGK